MIGVDTNVLVRLVTQDDAAQARRVDRLFASARRRGERVQVGAVVACELCWVLGRAYKHSREEIVAVLDALLDTEEIVVEDAGLLRGALSDYESGRGDFADAYLGRKNREAGCTTTYSFDSTLRRNETFTVLR